MPRHHRSPLFLPLVVVAGAALAQPGAAPGPSLPSAQQMLDVAVGGSHLPPSLPPKRVANPYEGNTDAIAQGGQLYKNMHCIECHAPEGGGAIGPALSDKAWIYGGEPAQIYLTIVQGRPNGMPAFGQMLSPDAVWKLVAYVRTLSQKPEPPPAGRR